MGINHLPVLAPEFPSRTSFNPHTSPELRLKVFTPPPLARHFKERPQRGLKVSPFIFFKILPQFLPCHGHQQPPYWPIQRSVSHSPSYSIQFSSISDSLPLHFNTILSWWSHCLCLSLALVGSSFSPQPLDVEVLQTTGSSLLSDHTFLGSGTTVHPVVSGRIYKLTYSKSISTFFNFFHEGHIFI